MEYGIFLIDNVHLIMPDGKEFCVHFSDEKNELVGLQNMMLNYSIGCDYVLFFDYVGRSHFLVSAYTKKGDDLFASIHHKVRLEDVMREAECPFEKGLHINVIVCETKALD